MDLQAPAPPWCNMPRINIACTLLCLCLFGQYVAASTSLLGTRSRWHAVLMRHAMRSVLGSVHPFQDSGAAPSSQSGANALPELMRKIAEKPSWPAHSGSSSLHSESAAGNASNVAALLDRKADVDAKNPEGLTAFQLALSMGHKEVAQLVYKYGGADKDSLQSIHWAVLNGNVDLVSLLLSQGADVNARFKDGSSVLHLAVRNKYTAVVDILLKSKAYVNIQSSNGTTPLHIAAQDGHGMIAFLLIANHAEFDIRDNDGFTPLDRAIAGGQLLLVSLLIKVGARLDSQINYFGIWGTGLHLAAMNGHADVVACLIGAGVPVSSTDGAGRYPLHYAAMGGHADVVGMLLSAGARPLDQDLFQTSALYYAFRAGHDCIVSMFLAHLAGTAVDGEKSPSK